MSVGQTHVPTWRPSSKQREKPGVESQGLAAVTNAICRWALDTHYCPREGGAWWLGLAGEAGSRAWELGIRPPGLPPAGDASW